MQKFEAHSRGGAVQKKGKTSTKAFRSSEAVQSVSIGSGSDEPITPKNVFIRPASLKRAMSNMANLERQRASRMKRLKAKARRASSTKGRRISLLNASSALDAGDIDRAGLWGCDSVAAVDAYIEKWDASFRRKATGALNRRKIDAMSSTNLVCLFDGTATSSSVMINENVPRDARQLLRTELSAYVEANPTCEIAFITIISGDGGTSHAKPDIGLFRAQAQAQATLRAMGRNYFAVSELAMFNSHSHPSGGQLLQEHTHALVFGEHVIARATAVAAKHMDRYTPNATNAPQIDVRKVETDPVNIARICAYMFKAPSRAMTWCPPRDGKKGHMHHSEKGDRKMRYLRMAMIRAMITVEDIMFAGGEGNRIRSQIVKLARAKCGAAAPPHRRLLHPDAIGAFCVDLAAKLKKSDWTLPIIKRQK